MWLGESEPGGGGGMGMEGVRAVTGTNRVGPHGSGEDFGFSPK